MCGIAGAFLRDTSFEVDLDGLLNSMLDGIEHRGGDACGFVALGDEGVTEWQKAACGARDFITHRRPVPKGTRQFIAHTRFATQGLPAFVENNHPLKRGDFFIIHNGVLNNDDELFELSEREPFGQVDSEAIAARLSSLGKLDGVQQVMEEIRGSAAIAAVNEREPDRLVLARGHSSPLFVLATKRIILFASTPGVITAAYKKFIGRLPKKTKIENVPEGVMLSFKRGAKTKRSSFTPYEPKPVKFWPGDFPAWSASSTETVRSPQRAVDDIDLVNCDQCNDPIPWSRIEYRQEEGYTLMFCAECAIDFDVEESEVVKVVFDDFEAANAASLLDLNMYPQ